MQDPQRATDMSDRAMLLLVEDDAAIRTLLHAALIVAGFEVCVAEDGAAALHVLANDNVRFAGIVTDIRLGAGPDGWDVARAARAANPRIAVIYMSGDSGHAWEAKGVADSGFVEKPFTAAAMMRQVRAHVEARSGAADL